MPITFQRTDGIHSRNAKLTEADVRAIRRKYDKGLRGSTEAKRMGISPVQFNKVGRREAWKHVV